MIDELKIFTGNSNPALAKEICDYLHTPLGEAEVFQFSNENIFVKIDESVRGDDVFIIQPTCSPVNQSIMELLIMIDALKRASARRITAVIPYYPYARSDKKDQPRIAITAKLMADLITVAGTHRVLTMDLHADQIQGFFNIPVDHLEAAPLLSEYFSKNNIKDPVVVSPDTGGVKRARKFASRLNAPLAIIDKRRVCNNESAEVMNVIGEVKGMDAIIFDEEIMSAGTVAEAAEALKREGAKDIYAACTHPVFSGPAIDRVKESPLVEVIVTNTIPLPEEKRLDKIKVISVAGLFGEAIRQIHQEGSISTIFT